MYALNTFFRITRFLANSIVGLVVGFGLGIIYATNGFTLGATLTSLGF